MAAILLLKPTFNRYLEEAADGMLKAMWEGRVRVGGCYAIVLGPAHPATKVNKNTIPCGLKRLPETIF